MIKTTPMTPTTPTAIGRQIINSQIGLYGRDSVWFEIPVRQHVAEVGGLAVRNNKSGDATGRTIVHNDVLHRMFIGWNSIWKN
jgi:hypothetical protein